MKQRFFKLFALLILTFSVGCGWLWMDFNGFMNSPADLPKSGINIQVVSGSTFSSVNQDLYKKGILRSVFYPKLAAKIFPELTKVKRGEYHISATMTPREIFEKLSSGAVISYQIRFIEGWTFSDFLTELAQKKTLQHDLSHLKVSLIAEALSIAHLNPEGWFYPDTYHYTRGTSERQILLIAHQKMAQKLEQYWQERDIGLPYDNPYQVLIMASIIEKETGLSAERNRIAGVFVRRLNKKMRLQTDPTVIYGIGATFNGDLTRRDLKAESPYNTYKIKGLPPTPIAMPSAASMSAAVHPQEGNELYFVARGDGSHQFSTTLEQHNRAVRQYQLKPINKNNK